jgi:hypothetical protein
MGRKSGSVGGYLTLVGTTLTLLDGAPTTFTLPL